MLSVSTPLSPEFLKAFPKLQDIVEKMLPGGPVAKIRLSGQADIDFPGPIDPSVSGSIELEISLTARGPEARITGVSLG